MRKIPNLKLSLGSILAVLALLAIAVVPVMAQPWTSPLSGNVTIDGVPAPVGSTVKAWVVGGDVSAQSEFVLTSAGYYELMLVSNAGGADQYKPISFQVKKVGEVDWFAATPDPADPTFAKYGNGEPQAVDLSATTGVTYDLTIASGAGGSVTTPGEGTFGPYDPGDVVALVATPSYCYEFDEWTGEVGTIANVYDPTTTITMNDDYSITANFAALPQYDLTISSGANGSVTTPGEGTFGPYCAGDVVVLVATADAGYQFDDWTGEVGTIADVYDPTTTITMNDDYLITANFEEGPPPPTGVGGTPYPPDKLGILAPWIVLGLAIVAGAVIIFRRRRAYN